MEIKEIKEGHIKNKKSVYRASVRLLDDIENLETLRKGRISDSLPELDKDIVSLQRRSNLQELLADLEKIYEKKSGIKGALKKVKTQLLDVDDLEKQIEDIRRQADRAYTRFLAVNGIHNTLSIGKVVAQNSETFTIVSNLQKVINTQVSNAKTNPALAGALFGVDSMTTYEKKRALHNAELELTDAEKEKKRDFDFITLKVKALRKAHMEDNPIFSAAKRTVPPMDGHSFRSTFIFRPNVDRVNADRSNAIQETLELLNIIRTPNSDTPAISWFKRATNLLSILEGSLGLKAEALELSQICYSLVKTLSQEHPKFFLGELSLSLHNLSSQLSSSGQHQEALQAIQEALQIRKQFAEKSPEVYVLDLAKSLNNLSNQLSSHGQYQEALQASQEAEMLKGRSPDVTLLWLNRTKAVWTTRAKILHPNEVPESPWQVVTVDLIGELLASNNFNAICVIVDHFSKQMHAIPMTTKLTAEGMAKIYRDHVFRLHGLPWKIIHDRGTQFDAKMMKELYKLLHIEGNPSMAYHPQTDGQTECVNQELEQYLRLYVNHRQTDWADWLSLAEFAYNNHEHSATKMSLFYANTGVHPMGLTDIHTSC
ncbi:hypothetical protein EW145_g3112 [Phellinidium pouzarii]|uniref:Integrase catalytic domain-containing protein n=1 Tax=Phellinidium pouzarii TaxID=167371 RepID=A0A4S4L8I9_9AGAM|nr:hypothetical protein EW145_g3112 [Phellinidium pouzarii]